MIGFKPISHKATQTKRIGVTVGVVVGATTLGLVVLSGLYIWRQKTRKPSSKKHGK